MENITVYDELDKIVQFVLKKFSESETILRLLAIDDSNALTRPLNGITFNDYQFKRWFPLPKNFSNFTESGSYLLVFYHHSNRAGNDKNNVYNDDIYFTVVFFCHESVWVLDKDPNTSDYKMRPYQLLSEIKKILDSSAVPQSYRQKFIVYPPSIVKPSNDFIGYEINFKITGCSKA